MDESASRPAQGKGVLPQITQMNADKENAFDLSAFIRVICGKKLLLPPATDAPGRRRPANP